MSNVTLPFLFKCDITKGHLVNVIQPFFAEYKFVTGSLKGELILWKLKGDRFDPTVLMVPSLNQSAGMATALSLIEMPEPKILVCSKICVVSVHSDNRIRIWDLNDGRCISISPHDPFPNEQAISKIRPLFSHNQRFLICQGYSNHLYIYDTWKMRILRDLTHEKAGIFVNTLVRSDKELIVIDNSSQIFIWDISQLNHDHFCLYSHYISNITNSNKLIRDVKERLITTKKVPPEVKYLPGGSSEDCKIVNFVVDRDSGIIVLLFNHKIVVFDLKEFLEIEDFSKTHLKFLNIFISDSDIFKDIQVISLENVKSLVIMDKLGNVYHLGMQDVIQFWSDLHANFDKEIHQNKSDYTYLKLKDMAYAQITLQPIFLVNRISRQQQQSGEEQKNVYMTETPENNLMSADGVAKSLLYLDHSLMQFQFYTLSPDVEDNVESFRYTCTSESKLSPYLQFKRRRSSILEASFIQDKGDFKKQALKPSIVSNIQSKHLKQNFFESIFHSFFHQSFQKGISGILNTDEEVIISTIAFYDKIDPMYVFGTNQGRALIFKMHFKETEPNYFYYVINLDQHPINVLFSRKNLLFVSSERGRLAVYSLTNNDLLKHHPDEEKVNSPLVGVDIGHAKKFETILASPLKRILRIKMLDHPELADADQSNLKEAIKSSSSTIGLILKSNAVICFDTQKLKAEFECRCNESSVLGIFIHPIYDYLLILNANGNINIFSTFTGMYERSVSMKDYSQALSVYDIIDDYSRAYYDLHKYHYFKDDQARQFPSPVHGVLEYNTRGHKNKIDYFSKISDARAEKKYEVISERVGDVARLKYAAHDSPHLVWLLHYCNESLYPTRYSRNGTVFLNLLLDQNCHIMLTDAKFSPDDETKRRITKELTRKQEKDIDVPINTNFVQKSKGKSMEYMESGFIFLSLIYPWGVDSDIEQNVKKIGGYNLPTFAFYHGLQGIGETFSFLVSENDQQTSGQELSSEFTHSLMPNIENWQTSEYMSSQHALSTMIYFVVNSHLQSELITATMIKFVELLNKRCPEVLPQFKDISAMFLSYSITSDDADIVSSMSNLIVSALIQAPKESDTALIKNLYIYLCTSLADTHVGKELKLANIETIFLSLLSYWSCFARTGGPLLPEIMDFTIDKIPKVIDLVHCSYHPYLVSAALKLLVDGITQYKRYIRSADDLFFHIIMIHFHYSITLDDSIFQKLQANEESSPTRANKSQQANFRSTVLKIGKQPIEIRRLLQASSLKTLLTLGDNYRTEFVDFITVQIKNVAANMEFPSVAINVVRQYIKKFPKSAANELPKLTEAILYCLDPNNPILRKSCQKAATNALQTMFKTFSFCAFNHATQKFAITAKNNSIMIYDLRTAVCVKTLEGHAAPISCVLFDSNGSHLASFSEGDMTLRVWKIAGFFGSVIGLGGKYKKTFEIPRDKIERENRGERKFRLEWNSDESFISLIVDESLTLQYGMKK